MTALEIVTLVVALIGAVTGVAALLLQAVTWSRSGPVLKAKLYWAWIGQNASVLVPITGPRPPSGPPPELRPAQLMYAVEVVNTGRAPATISKVDVALPDGTAFREIRPTVGPGVPHRLEAEDGETFYVPGIPLTGAGSVIGQEPIIRGRAHLGSGRIVSSKPHRVDIA